MDAMAVTHRKYGQDTRPLAALVIAHNKAMEGRGVGSMWAGGYNHGYLCTSSLRYMEAFKVPRKENMATSGMNSTEAGLFPEAWEGEYFPREEGKIGKQLRKNHIFWMKQTMCDVTRIRCKNNMTSLFDSFHADPTEVEREERVWLLSGGERDPQNQQFKANSNNGGGGGSKVASDIRGWLNDQPFVDEDQTGLERLAPTADDGISRMKDRSETAATTRSPWGRVHPP